MPFQLRLLLILKLISNLLINFKFLSLIKNGGAKRDRTDDLLAASEALSQLSYSPILSSELLYVS